MRLPDRFGLREHPDAAEQRRRALGAQTAFRVAGRILRRCSLARCLPRAQRVAVLNGIGVKLVAAVVFIERQQRLCFGKLCLAPPVMRRVYERDHSVGQRRQRERGGDERLAPDEPACRSKPGEKRRKHPERHRWPVLFRRQPVKFAHIALCLVEKPFLVHPGKRLRAIGARGRGCGRLLLRQGKQSGRLLRKHGQRVLTREPRAYGGRGVFPVCRLHRGALRVIELRLFSLGLRRLQRPQVLFAGSLLRLQRLQLRAQRQIFFMLPRQRGQRAVYGGKLPLGVRDESGLVVPDAVLPGKPLVGCGKADGLVPGRDKGGQPRFQLVVRRQAESGLTDKGAALIHTLRNAQKRFAAVRARHALDRQAGIGIDGGKYAERCTGRRGARERDAPPGVLKLDHALHGWYFVLTGSTPVFSRSEVSTP